MIMEPTAAAEHTLTFWNGCFPISQPCDLSFHLLNWLALFSCSVPCDLSASASLLSHLCPHLSLLSSAYFSLSLSPWLVHSLLLPFPALSLHLVNFILGRFKKKKAEENITTKQNTYLKKDDLSKKGWGDKKANVKEWVWEDESEVQLQLTAVRLPGEKYPIMQVNQSHKWVFCARIGLDSTKQRIRRCLHGCVDRLWSGHTLGFLSHQFIGSDCTFKTALKAMLLLKPVDRGHRGPDLLCQN